MLTWSADLIFWMVQESRLLTVSTDSMVSFAVGRLFTKIWNATVTREPVLLLPLVEVVWPLGEPWVGFVGWLWPSGRMANPDGRRETYAESPPFMTTCMDCTSTGAYTTREPDESVQVSCKMSMLFWLPLVACNIISS